MWTQLSHSLIANMWTMARKFRLSFSKRVASLRMSFTVQKKRLRPYQPGIGPHTETQTVELVVRELYALSPERYAKVLTAVP